MSGVIIVVIHSLEQTGLATSKMKRHRHLTMFEWHGLPGVVSFDRSKILAQQGQVLNVIEMSRDRMSVLTLYRNDPQQR